DVVFAAGQFSPHTVSGRRLLAHELTHVVQQQGLRQSVQPAGLPVMGRAGDPSEAEAEAAAASVAAGGSARSITPLAPSPLQRQAKPEWRGEEPHASDVTKASDNKPAERVLTRPEERSLSVTSPGGVTGTVEPLMVSVYNFAIEQATLKNEHRAVIKEMAGGMEGAKAGPGAL